MEKHNQNSKYWKLLLAAALLTTMPWVVAPAQASEDSTTVVAVDTKELERQLEEARKQLDAAARKLGKLNVKLYGGDAGGHGKKPMLGVLVDTDHSTDGVPIVGVTPKGGASASGLKAGDRLVAINGYRLDSGEDSMQAMQDAMKSVEIGDTVSVEYVRDDTAHIADVTTQSRKAFVMKMDLDKDFDFDFDFSGLADLAKLEELNNLGDLSTLEGVNKFTNAISFMPHLTNGLQLEDVEGDLAGYFGVDSGVLVMNPPQDSELRAGDVLLSLDGEDVESATAAIETLITAESDVSAKVLRDKKRKTVTIKEIAADIGRHKTIHIKSRSGDTRIVIERTHEDDNS